MKNTLDNTIADAFSTESIISIINCKEFYFQKGRDALNSWLNYSLDDTTQKRLFHVIKDYNIFKNLNEGNEFFEVKELFFEIISYCDLHASNKEKYNKYLDKRVLAKAGVRMSPWVNHLYNYKYHPEKTNITVKNALDVLIDPSNNINSISTTHRRLISQYYLNSPYNVTTFVEDLKKHFTAIPSPKIDENITILIARILYNQKENWIPKNKNFKDFTNDFEQYLNDQNLPYKIVKKDNEWFWIADSEGNFNSENIHYELITNNRNEISIDLHFEKDIETAKQYQLVIGTLPDFLDWKEWDKWGNCITHKQKVNLGDVDSIENAIVYLNELYDYTIEFYRKDKQAMKEKVRLLEYKKQIILQGPPGTGKTREAKLIAQQMLGLTDVELLKDHDQFKLVQFHPSYTYEDFVRGIIAESKDNQVKYTNVNKVLGEFAEKALKNFNASTIDASESNLNEWIDEKFEDFKNNIQAKLPEEETKLSGDTITIFEVKDDHFKYAKNWQTPGYLKFSEFKNLVRAILQDEIKLTSAASDLDKEKFLHAHYRYTYYNALLVHFFGIYKYEEKKKEIIATKNYVLLIDEINRANLSSVLGELIYALEYRGEAVDSMYAVENSILTDKNKLILPPNLYIIGTMNTADRSVGHIDYAIRRRFAFVDIPPEKLEDTDRIYFNDQGFEAVEKLFNSGALSNEFEVKDVQIGHSYFIAKKEDAPDTATRDSIFFMKMQYEVKPILREYLKDGIFIDGKQIEGKDIRTYIEELGKHNGN